ncbi:hypothetical protein SAMN05445756_0365 [Kytococcus aerolatus]|uniref:Alpha/beta hydrolase family protein n=1 Tax=Kytococcus aerolatus TaxID=592308 RepID=A0A212T4S5_9MICO|nr:hypothetical protein [Kytococcus aerolatus]SNC60860.1 hypothetical protein SAMN05445756_0365 [Kytococcus aerolatus]
MAGELTRWAGTGESSPGARRVLVLPGAGYNASMPGLALPMRALTLDGWDVWHAQWSLSGGSREDARGVVEGVLSQWDTGQSGPPDLVVGKSIGTMGAGWVADHGIPAVWTTPLLTDEGCVRDLARATAPALLVAGTEDAAWDDAAVARIEAPAHRIEGADHGWHTGDWRRELEVLRELTEAVAGFAAELR